MADNSKFNLFGFRIGKKEEDKQPSFAPPSNEDGATTVTSAAQFGMSALDLDGSVKNEVELITRYREMAMQPEIESAVDDIVNEAIVHDDNGKSVEIVMDELKQPDKLKNAIKEEFDNIIRLLNYDNMGTDIFRRYYIDGRLNYHVMIDISNPQKGILELRYIDPRKIKKVREIKKQKDEKTGVEIVTSEEEYFVYSEKISSGPATTAASAITGVKIAPDSIISVNSGLMDAKRGMVLSYLHKAIKPLNQLRMIEDAVVIYRLSRAPERRIFYIDVGNLPRPKAEQHVRDMMTKYKNKLVYDSSVGLVRDDRRHLCLSMDTKVPLLDGRTLSLSEIAEEYKNKELWAYSCNPETGEFVPGLITWAGVSNPNAQIMRLTLDNGKTIDCTPEHRFPVWNVGMVEAKDLKVGDSMMSFNEQNTATKDCKIIQSEYLEERADTGCLTIDGDEKYHNYHTFALDAGIYTQNSMVEDFWIPRREGKTTEITTLPAGCFAMDTKVSLLDGRELSIREIESELSNGNTLWTYSCEPISGKIVPGLISWAGVTQKSAKVMEIILDNGEKIVCTPEHKFPQYDQQYKEAKDFCIGDSLIPLYRKKSPINSGASYTYEQVFDNGDRKWKFTHRLVSSLLRDQFVNYSVYNEEYSNGNYDVVHHIDFNRYNNSPENLCYMSWKDHSKLHQDNIEILRSRPDYIEKLSIGVNNYYKNRSEEERQQHSERTSNMWKNFSEEKYQSVCDNISEAITNYCANLSEEEREIRAESSRKNFKKGNEVFVRKLLEDEEYKTQVYDKIKSSWTEEMRKEAGKRFSDFNITRWQSDQHRELHRKLQKVEFSHDMLREIINLVKDKTTHQVTLLDVQNELNNNPILLDQLKELNKFKSVPNWCINDGFTAPMLTKLVQSFGYDSWKDFRVKESIHNHRIVGIRYLDDPIEVGTLTIDKNEIYHDHHTFALSCGVFVFNSNLGRMEDVEYFEKKLYKSLNVPVTRLDPSQAVSIGRSTEITRDELKFAKFVAKLRNKFAELFDQALRLQLVLKGICTEEEWQTFKENISYDFIKDNNFVELKEAELMQERLGILAIIDQYSGKYYSKRWIQQHVLRLNDIEIADMEKEIDEEKDESFKDQAEDQVKQIQIQAQGVELQNKLMPNPEVPVEAGQQEEQEQPQQQKKNPANPYDIR